MDKCYAWGGWTILVIALHSTQVQGVDSNEVKDEMRVKSVGPCSRIKDGLSHKDVTFDANVPMKMEFETPHTWASGKYICIWNVEMMHREPPFYGIKVDFPTLTIPRRGRKRCRDRLFINHFDCNGATEYSHKKFCKIDQLTVRTDWKTVQLRLEVAIPRNDDWYGTKFTVVFSSNDRWEHATPTFFEVADIINAAPNYSPIKDYDFTWQDARDFCQQSAPGFDLCYSVDACPKGRVPFPEKLDNKTLQYFPALLFHNNWLEVEAPGCNDYHKEKPIYKWGFNKTLCPEGGCKAKSHLYCCFHAEPKTVRPVPDEIPVTVRADTPGKYAYRFPKLLDRDPDRYLVDPDALYWGHHWHEFGRLEGDVNKFGLFAYYSPDFPTPVYFCSMYQLPIPRWMENEKGITERHIVETHRFMASLEPCATPWKFEFHAFGSTAPRDGLTAIYFGYHSEEVGSRVSVTPPCCGYDKPENTFVIYGVVKDEWKAKIAFCSKNDDLTGPSGTISSPFYPESTPEFMDCKWTIRVKEGHGILVSVERPHWECKIWFTNPNSGAIYGRYEGGQLLSHSNVLEVFYSNPDNGCKSFAINYTEVDYQASLPQKFTLKNEEATWSAAEELCKTKKMRLCAKKEICPLSTHVMTEPTGYYRWVAVRDQYNDWVQTGNFTMEIDYYGPMCFSYISRIGPPVWGEAKIEKKPCVGRSHATDECNANRDEVYCCKISREDSNIIPGPATPDPVRVIVAYSPDLGAYWFNKSDEWSTPKYQNREFKLPGSLPGAAGNIVDYFILSSKYMKGHFEQILYFCYGDYEFDYYTNIQHNWRFQVALAGCEPGTAYDFFLYAGRRESDFAKVPVHFGKALGRNGKVCCEGNNQSFTVYAIDAGRKGINV